jgi:hypothetical protein
MRVLFLPLELRQVNDDGHPGRAVHWRGNVGIRQARQSLGADFRLYVDSERDHRVYSRTS